MDLCKHHANKKRKLSKSKENEKHLKRKDQQNYKLTDWLGRCCTWRKHDITSIQNNKLPKISIEKMSLDNEHISQQFKSNLPIQSTSIEKVSNIRMAHLKQSPLYSESKFCQKAFESSYDSCIAYTVQYGPDLWEDIPGHLKNSNQQLYDNNKSISIARLATFRNKKINDNDVDSFSTKEISTNEALNPFEINLNSFINNIIGDGVDRVAEIIIMESTHHHHKLLTNTENNFQLNESNQRPSNSEQKIKDLDIIKQHQHQYPGLVFEKQNLKCRSPMYHHSSVQLVLHSKSSKIIPDEYNWDLASNKTNFNQQKLIDKINSSENQEPYNWDYQEDPCSSSAGLSEKNHFVEKSVHAQSKQLNDPDHFLSDVDDTDHSYTIASVLPLSTTKKAQLHTIDIHNSNLSLDILNQQQDAFSISEFHESATRLSDHRNKNEYSEEKIYPSESNDEILMNLNQQQKSIPGLMEDDNLLLTIKSTHSSELTHNKIQRINSSKASINNDRSLSKHIPSLHEQQQPSFNNIELRPSSQINQLCKLVQQNDQFSSTSDSELFKEINYTRKKYSLDSDSINTSVLLETITDKHNRNNVQSSRTTLVEDHYSISSNTETKQLQNLIILDANDQISPPHINLATKCSQSHTLDHQEKQVLPTEINNRLNQTRSTFEDIINSWRRLFERLVGFMLPSIHSTGNNIDLSSSIISSDSHSWSTWIPTETLNMIQSDNIGPWWGRRDTYDRTPATFIFANESLNTLYSIETITSNKQMCISIENRPCCSKYYSYPNTCHCSCRSSISINNSPSST